ncbi:ABC transporter substrate-binding protein [Rodentibacter myodis]|nr:ABC transporter substrate-binding protein [Rodentibacter myodis]
MEFLKTPLKLTALFSLLGLASQSVQAAGKLTVYCSVQNTTCEKVTQAFAKKYNVETQFVRNSTGTVLGKIKAEQKNPQADVWYGGTIEPHLQAVNLDLFERYRSPMQKEIMPKFKPLMDQWGDFTSVIYLMEMGIGVNTKKLRELGVAPPKCFADLTKPEFKNQIQYADPRVSGTGYSLLSTLISLWGENKTYDYLKTLNNNISQYTKTGMATSNLATGDVAIDLGFMLSYAKEKNKGAPVEGVLPCEGVGYALGAASIIKNARNLENAKLFIDFVLGKDAQEIPWREGDSYQLPTNINAQPAPGFTPADKLKLIDIDFVKFGSPQESKYLIERWVTETKSK